MTNSQPLDWFPAVLDRESDARARAGFLAGVVTEGTVRTLVLDGGAHTFGPNHGPVYFSREDAEALRAQAPSTPLTVYLGRTLGSTDALPANCPLMLLSGVDAAHAAKLAPEGSQWAGFRDMASVLNPQDTAVVIEALAISNWHSTHQHCPRCGVATEIAAAGWVRTCPTDGTEHYPRTDPAIIAAVVGPDDRILLGGGRNWDANRFSTLAGFVEPGEALEQAVVREIAEEVGVRVHAVEYLGSQAWPFPASLMLGYLAYTSDTEATPDGEEVTRARWISREQMQPLVSSGEIVIAGRLSIARRLIEHWYGGTIYDAGELPAQEPAVGSVAP